MPTLLIARPIPDMYACRQDCTKRAMDRLWRKPALTRNHTSVRHVLLRWMAGTPNATNPQEPTPHQEAPVRDITHAAPSASTEPTRSPEEEARDILATAAKNRAENGPNTRRAAVRACKYLRAMVNQYGSTIQEVHKAARIHTQMSKGTAGQPHNIVHKEESSQ